WIGQLRPRLDLIVKIEPHDRDALGELSERMGWAHVARFAQAWSVVGSRLDAGVRAAWLELDLDPRLAPEAALRAPRMFVDFTRAAQCQPEIEARLDLASEVLATLSGVHAPPALRTCLERLPDGASVASLCVLAGEPPIVRACVVGVADRLTAYLAAIGWPGDIDALARRVLDPFTRAHGEDAIGVVHLDLAAEVAPRIGLEYTFPRPGRATGLRSADTFLRQLVARGWCTARNRESLRAWPRRSVELLPHDVWHSRVTRQIAHIKLAYTPGEPVVAKAYLRTTFDLLAGGTLVHGRPRRFSWPGDGAPAPSDGAVPPSAPAGGLQALDRPAVRARARDGTSVAFLRRELRRVTGMTMSTAQQEALEQILNRATVDLEFRKALLHDPRKAIHEGLGIRIPANFRVKFIERHKDVDALIVLPDLVREDGELDDCDLDAVAGGADGDAPLPW
ncbi:MAG TPA: NHLP leader peptide family RiPP precursor, partial [Kofleriaceae bacterium]|nr:NHLP leader peptide family RiPP precursor [Kofleriaceae bacterium]